MKSSRQKYRKPALAVSTLVLIIILLIPVKIPYSITTMGKVFPLRDFMLIKSTAGSISSQQFNYLKGINEKYNLFEFERGDAVEISVAHTLISGSPVYTGDKIASVYSNTLEKDLVELNSQLETEIAQLDVFLKGEKESAIQLEEKRVSYAQKQIETQETLHSRNKILFDQNLISQEDYELSASALELFKLNYEIAKQSLKVVSSGAKPEEISLVKKRIDGLREIISELQNKFNHYSIMAPFNGIVKRTFSADTMLILQDTSSYILILAIESEHRDKLDIGQKVFISLPAKDFKTESVISAIDNSFYTINQNSVFFVSTKIDNSGKSKYLLPGALAECEIVCESILIRDYIFNFFSSLISF